MRTPEYICWCNLRQRCNNPNNPQYHDYGGRGITVCERWDSFELFLEDMGERPSPEHSIERIDNDSHYGPDNCCWATKSEQLSNRRPIRFHTSRPLNNPLYYISERGGKYRLEIHLRKGERYRRTFDTLDEALVARADCEMEREMYHLLGGV